MILVQKGLIYHPVKKSAVDKEMHTQLGLATRVIVFTNVSLLGRENLTLYQCSKDFEICKSCT